MKTRKMKKKYEAFYPKMKTVCLRYGIHIDFYNDTFIEHNSLEFEELKKMFILKWVSNPQEPINEKTDNVYLNAITELNPIQRIVFNMHCIDSFDFDIISEILEIKKDLIISFYNKAKFKLEENEEIINAISNDVDNEYNSDKSTEPRLVGAI